MESMNYLNEVREWIMLLMEAGILYFVGLEYFYDKNKDDLKKQKKVRTTKKTTTQPDGSSSTEESMETTEPMEEKK